MKAAIAALALWHTLALAAPPCASPRSSHAVARCVVEASFSAKADEAALTALQGKRDAMGVFLPSNPQVSISLASRRGANDHDTNWYVTLSQEFDVAGKAGTRTQVVDAEIRGQRAALAGARRDLAAAAMITYYELLAAKERLSLATLLSAAWARTSETLAMRAEKGVATSLEATVATATAIEAQRRLLQAQEQQTRATIQLSSLLHVSEAALDVSGTLAPVVTPGSAPSVEVPEVKYMLAEKESAEARAAMLRRARVPNLTVSGYLQNDGFSERVVGLGVGVPVPLPWLGQTYRGDIAEAESRRDSADLRVQEARRVATQEAALRRTRLANLARERELYTQERSDRAKRDLASLQTEVENGRVSVRDAVVAQQALVELLQNKVEVQLALCIASVELAQALGMDLLAVETEGAP